jgi:peptidyl-prolyl cis-trans isomerase D
MSIQSLRDSSEGIIAKILVGLIIIVFALFGFGSITTFLSPTPKVATVNGEDITQQEMELAVERNRRLMLANNTSPADINEDELRADVLTNLVNRSLLLQAANELGFFFGDAGIDQDIVTTPVFQIDGQFSADQFQLVIGSAGFTPLSYREEMKSDKRLQQLATGIQGSAFMTDSEVERTTSLAQQTRDIAFLRIELEGLMEQVDISDAEMRAYYDEHPGDFMTEETVDLAYLELNRSALMDDVETDEDELLSFYEDSKAQYAQEESRRVAHILIESNDEISSEEALVRITEVSDRIIGGESFEEVAKEVSEDPGSAVEGGDLGFNAPGTFVEEFEEAANALSLNQMSQPVETEFGWHLIKLLDVEPAKTPSFEEVRDRVESSYRESVAEQIFVEKSGRLSEMAFESPDLQEPAAELELEIKTTGHVTRDVEDGIGAEPGVMDAAFGPDVLLDGNNSRLIEITPNHHVVVRVREHRPQEQKSFETVASAVREVLAREKATALAEARAKEAVDMLASGSLTRYVADQLGLTWQVVPEIGRNQMGMDSEINEAAFKLPRPEEGNKSVGYKVLSDGDAAIVSVTNVKNAPIGEFEADRIDGLSRILANQRGFIEYQEFRDQLRATAEIEKSG